MLQPRRRLGLRLKAGQLVGRSQRPAEDHLHRHVALQARLPGAIDDAHPAAAQLFRNS